MAGITCSSRHASDVRGRINGDHIGVLPFMTGTTSTGGNVKVVVARAQEADEVGVTGIAVRWYRAQRNVNARVIADDIGRAGNGAGFAGRTAMAGITAAGNASVVHALTDERAGIGMARFTGQLRREMRRRFADHPEILAVVASGTAAGYPEMLVAFYQEVGCADVAGVTFAGCRYMVDRFGRGRNSRAGGVTTRTYLGSVLENAFDVALFAL